MWIFINNDCYYDRYMRDEAISFWRLLIARTENPTKAELARAAGFNRQDRVAHVLRALDLEVYRAQVYEEKKKSRKKMDDPVG
jgi:hypothetical protein